MGLGPLGGIVPVTMGLGLPVGRLGLELPVGRSVLVTVVGPSLLGLRGGSKHIAILFGALLQRA